MGIVVAAVLALLAVVVVAYIAFVVLGARASAAAGREGTARDVEALKYDVPDGQDPVVVLSALREAGYEPASDLVEGSTTVVVPCPSGVDRERTQVRSVIAGASETTVEGPEFDPGRVTFQDEKSA